MMKFVDLKMFLLIYAGYGWITIKKIMSIGGMTSLDILLRCVTRNTHNEWFHFEDVLKEDLESREGDVLGLHGDLLGAAIGQIDTREIAKQWIENELENMEVTG